jgi:hypothetical protein
MKTPVFPIHASNPRFAKVFKWGKLITITGGAQALVQATSLLCGIAIIRLLSTQEYAIYTLGNAMLTTITLLADGGVSTGVMSEGSKVWKDKEQLGVVLATGFDLRKQFAKITGVVVVPIMVYLLIHHNTGYLNTFLITVSLVPAFLASLSDSIYEVAPKLHQDLKPLQQNQIMVSVGRSLLSGLSLLIFPYTFVAFLANAIPRIYGNIQLKKIAGKNASINVVPDKIVRENILKIVKRSLPSIMFYSMSGQITIWLISVFGQTKSIATIGALGRLAMITTVFASVFSILIVPRFARLLNQKKLLRPAFVKMHVLLYVICAVFLLSTTLASGQLLWILGEKYVGFKNELFLSMLGSCIFMLVGGTNIVSATKGWIIHPVRSISVSLFSIISGIILFDVSSLQGVLYLNIFIATIEYFNQLIFVVSKIGGLKE